MAAGLQKNSKEGGAMWKEGSLKVYSSIFHYWIKETSELIWISIETGDMV